MDVCIESFDVLISMIVSMYVCIKNCKLKVFRMWFFLVKIFKLVIE